ncbi:hypothetical protein BK126_04360 [Paenibacillus sp. FSL H7-0326]|uniref:phage holin, LLH family n=1 Tax=Paenibacillus sp. FSL H7-0326 TaxID=1921144 RepID=UPI00096CA5BE|nr:phage holin, LLH family [Paenibacillus sp. FSL H7-0326]OMC71335.1 hypothetical protein BK126_04360 [Paenibacillus sp. FSL H7-0326]
MNSILEYFQPVVTNVVLSVLAVVIAAIGLFIVRQWRALGAWINAKKAAAEAQGMESIQNALWSVAQEAYAKAESSAADLAGNEKMSVALDYAVKKLNQIGISVHTDEVKAKIHEAWIKLDQIPKTQAGVTDQVILDAVKLELDKVVQS